MNDRRNNYPCGSCGISDRRSGWSVGRNSNKKSSDRKYIFKKKIKEENKKELY